MVTVDELREKRDKEKLKKKAGIPTPTEATRAYPYCERCRTIALSAIPGGRNCRMCGDILGSIKLPMTITEHKEELKRKEFRKKRPAPIKCKDVKGEVSW